MENAKASTAVPSELKAELQRLIARLAEWRSWITSRSDRDLLEDSARMLAKLGDIVLAAPRAAQPVQADQQAQALPTSQKAVAYVHLVPDEFSDSYDVRFWEPVPMGTPLYRHPVIAAPAQPIKDHIIAQTVNELRDIAVKYHDYQSLREKIAHVVVPLLKGKNN